MIQWFYSVEMLFLEKVKESIIPETKVKNNQKNTLHITLYFDVNKIKIKKYLSSLSSSSLS